MAKNNNKKGPKIHPSYFELKRQQSGDDFMLRMTPDQIRRDMPRIVRDIAYRNIDVMKDYQSFMNISFLNQLELYATEQSAVNAAYGCALIAYTQSGASGSTDPIYGQLAYKHMRAKEGYDKILTYTSIMRSTGDPNYIYPLMGELFPLRSLF